LAFQVDALNDPTCDRLAVGDSFGKFIGAIKFVATQAALTHTTLQKQKTPRSAAFLGLTKLARRKIGLTWIIS
jgi:hypothetical protein